MNGRLPKELNNTYLVLIPKVQGAKNFSQYVPINLCNTKYKIIAKLLVQRIMTLLYKFINRSQTNFVASLRI